MNRRLRECRSRFRPRRLRYAATRNRLVNVKLSVGASPQRSKTLRAR